MFLADEFQICIGLIVVSLISGQRTKSFGFLEIFCDSSNGCISEGQHHPQVRHCCFFALIFSLLLVLSVQYSQYRLLEHDLQFEH